MIKIKKDLLEYYQLNSNFLYNQNNESENLLLQDCSGINLTK